MGIDLEKPLRTSLSIEDWDKRFTLQAFWSRKLRETCFKEFPLSPFSKILEVGSGTGSLLSTLPHVPGLSVQVVDVSDTGFLHLQEIENGTYLPGVAEFV